jgi:hypothetical protein
MQLLAMPRLNWTKLDTMRPSFEVGACVHQRRKILGWRDRRVTTNIIALCEVYAILGVATKGHEGIEADYHASINSIVNQILRNKYAATPPTSLDEVKDDCKFLEAVFKNIGAVTRCQPNCPPAFYNAGCRWTSKWCWYGWAAQHGHTNVQILIAGPGRCKGSDLRFVKRDHQLYTCPCHRYQ